MATNPFPAMAINVNKPGPILSSINELEKAQLTFIYE